MGERWVGKNWACSRAMEQVVSEWVLFVDADLRLQPATLRRALAQAITDGADLLSLAPRLSCGCLAEWLVQPIMASLLGLGFPIEAANDPASAVAFAAGPFMLFRRSAYLAIGGHRALAAEVVGPQRTCHLQELSADAHCAGPRRSLAALSAELHHLPEGGFECLPNRPAAVLQGGPVDRVVFVAVPEPKQLLLQTQQLCSELSAGARAFGDGGDQDPLPAPLARGIVAVGVAGGGASFIHAGHRLLTGKVQGLLQGLIQRGADPLADRGERSTAHLDLRVVFHQLLKCKLRTHG